LKLAVEEVVLERVARKDWADRHSQGDGVRAAQGDAEDSFGSVCGPDRGIF
jgi:hypothetical protein